MHQRVFTYHLMRPVINQTFSANLPIGDEKCPDKLGSIHAYIHHFSEHLCLHVHTGPEDLLVS